MSSAGLLVSRLGMMIAIGAAAGVGAAIGSLLARPKPGLDPESIDAARRISRRLAE